MASQLLSFTAGLGSDCYENWRLTRRAKLAVVVSDRGIAQDRPVIAGRTGLVAAAAAFCLPLLAHAQGPTSTDPASFPVTLDYVAEPACPEAEALKAIVVARVGYDPFRDGAPNRVSVRLASRGRGLEGHVEWRDAAGKWTGDRTFPSRTDDCHELVRAVGFALAVQIQLLAIANPPARPPESDTPAAEPPPPTVAPAASEPQPTAVTAVAPPPSPPAPAVFALGAGASVGVGLSSGPMALGRVVGSVAWTHVALELAAELSLPATTRRADAAGFSQQELLASAAVCGLLSRLSACALAKAGQIRITGDIDVPLSPSGPLFQSGLRLGVTQDLGDRAYLAAHADGLVNVTRWTVELDDVPVWTAPRFAATFGVDVGIRFR
jgi:hypothetical protein